MDAAQNSLRYHQRQVQFQYFPRMDSLSVCHRSTQVGPSNFSSSSSLARLAVAAVPVTAVVVARKIIIPRFRAPTRPTLARLATTLAGLGWSFARFVGALARLVTLATFATTSPDIAIIVVTASIMTDNVITYWVRRLIYRCLYKCDRESMTNVCSVTEKLSTNCIMCNDRHTGAGGGGM